MKNGVERRKKRVPAGKIFLGVLTFLNLLLSLALAVVNRQQVVKAVREDEQVRLLLRSEKETKPLPGGEGETAGK